ncbi:MAG TPA: DUF4157 domain-containing protein, partial [Kofleriaceae bacterium]|nr:DUF4157 domain-containing protein [Kofleriaceae bacterium]
MQRAPGKQTLTEQLPAHEADAPGVHEIADRGMSGAPGSLPHVDVIQRAFGSTHDVSGVRSFVGGPAASASAQMGASAYAKGNQVAFAASPDLHTAAHEAAHVIQQRGGVQLAGGVGTEGDAYERHADAVADRVVRGESAAALLDAAPHGDASSAVQRAVLPTPTARRDRTALVGDGTPGKPGITLGEFQGYISQQADWFTEPTLDPAARGLLWELANMLQEGPQIGAALSNLRLAELINMLPADQAAVRAFAAGSATTAQTVRITRPPAKLDRAIELGKAMVDLQAFVPSLVLRICINQTTLEALVDEKLIDRLREYYAKFSPTIENPAEQAPLLALLRGGLAPFAPLIGWVHDLHVFTPATRLQLVANVADKSRKRPVMLVLMSGLDWNAAFLQAANLASAVANPANLALVVQGSASLGAATAMVNKVADDYGQVPKAGGKARLGQVVIAGHGQADLVEQTTPGTGAFNRDDKTVGYTQAEIHPTAPGDDSEKLIDTILTRMDPADARVVFAGCLVGS